MEVGGGGVVVGMAVGGCQDLKKKQATRPTTGATWTEGDATTRPEVVTLKPQPRSTEKSEVGAAAGAQQEMMLTLDVYTISVPAGAVSGNEEFWKRVEEDEGVTPAAHRMLDNNGIRVGTAALEGWPYFKEIIDRNPAATRLANFYMVAAAKPCEMEMRKDVATQTLFYLDDAGRLKGKTYDNCANYWSMSFGAVAREPGVTRVTMSPLIRSQQRRLEVIAHRAHPDDPPTREIAYVYPEYLFDLALDARIPAGRFLVVAASTKATGGSVGEAFMTGEGLGQRVERVMLMVPRQMQATVRVVVKKEG